jgi:hypothetical protein
MRKLRLTISLAALGAAALIAARAEAATQILGLMASNGIPTPLACEDGVCRGFLSGFCLQPERPAPALGSRYRLAPGGGLAILAERADGRVVRLPGEGVVSLAVDGGFTSVAVSLPESLRMAAGAVSLAIEVAPLTLVLPMPEADDPDPQSPEEIAEASGPLRRLAAGIFDRSAEDPDAARVVALLINRLPPEAAPGPVALKDLFHQVVASAGTHVGAEGLSTAERIAGACESFPANSAAIHFCLEVQQNGLLGRMNEQLWEAMSGS